MGRGKGGVKRPAAAAGECGGNIVVEQLFDVFEDDDRDPRLAAIMAVDVVGYSRPMGEDETGTALSVREHREAARPIVAGLGARQPSAHDKR